MNFVKIRYSGNTRYTDRTALKNAWEPGDVKMVSEPDAKTLLRYLEFKVVDSDAKRDKGKTEGVGDPQMEQAQLAQAKADAQAKLNRDAIEDTLVEVSVMEKDALEAYAKQNYGVDLDKRRSLDNLRNQVTELVQGGVN